MTMKDFQQWRLSKPKEETPKEETMVKRDRDLDNECQFLMKMYPGMFDENMIKNLLKSYESFS